MKIYEKPVFFKSNRVRRVYTGGKLLAEFVSGQGTDGFYPEEWIASATASLGKDCSDPDEGKSVLEENGWSFDAFLKAYPSETLGGRDKLGILTKFLDSAVRLPVQAHPDRAFSRRYFNSDYGKTEAWIILGLRQNARIYLGFKDKISRERLAAAVEESETDKDAFTPLLNEIHPKVGDVYLIPAKTVHAIGYGCLILEVQEPTDFTLQPERWCADYKLNDYEMYLGLDRDTALDCFDLTVFGADSVKAAFKSPKKEFCDETYAKENIITAEDTPCFSINRYKVGTGSFTLHSAPSVCVVTQGCGEIRTSAYSRKIKQGDYFFLPFCLKDQVVIQSQTGLELIECLPPQNERSFVK